MVLHDAFARKTQSERLPPLAAGIASPSDSFTCAGRTTIPAAGRAKTENADVR